MPYDDPAKARAWRQANRERLAAQKREWQRANRDRISSERRAARAAMPAAICWNCEHRPTAYTKGRLCQQCIEQTRERAFWSRVNRDPQSGCWLWAGSTNLKGYGSLTWGRGVTVTAHRVAWRLTRGAIPTGEGHHGTCVLHRCDVPLCVNPAHLFLGTNADNVHDMIQKGRARNGERRIGEQNTASKLTAEKVLELRRLHADGVSFTDLGARFGVSGVTARNVVTGKVWRHVGGAA